MQLWGFGVLQAVHTKETWWKAFFYFGVHRSWLGMAQKWSILDQNWPNMAGLSKFQSGPKWSKRDQNCHPKWLRPFRTLLSPSGLFRAIVYKKKSMFCSGAPPPNPTLSIWGKQFIFLWNGPKVFRWAQKGPKWSKTLGLAIALWLLAAAKQQHFLSLSADWNCLITAWSTAVKKLFVDV